MRLLNSNFDDFTAKENADGSTVYSLEKQNYFTSYLYLKFIETPHKIFVSRKVDRTENNAVFFTDTIENTGKDRVENLSLYGFIPDATEFEVLTEKLESEITKPEAWYVYSINLPNSLEPGKSTAVSYKAQYDSGSYQIPKVTVRAGDQLLANSNFLESISEPPSVGPESMPPIQQTLQATCSVNSCGACGESECGSLGGDCAWQDGQCKGSCGNLGRIAGETPHSIQDPQNNKECSSQDLGDAWDADLCCNSPMNEIDCFAADDWGGSARGAQLIKELHEPCQPDVSIDDSGFIDQNECWMKMQAGWAIFDYVNHAGVNHYTELTEEQYVLAILRFVKHNMTWINDEANEDCLCGLNGWCFGSPKVINCEDYHVSYAWFDDWGCDYPIQARHIWKRGTCDDCPDMYCGDCDDFGILRASLLRSAGFNSSCVWVASYPGHAFNVINYDDAYRVADYRSEPYLTDPHQVDDVCNDYHGGFFYSQENGPVHAQDWVWNYPIFNYYDPVGRCAEPWNSTESFNINVCGDSY